VGGGNEVDSLDSKYDFPGRRRPTPPEDASAHVSVSVAPIAPQIWM